MFIVGGQDSTYDCQVSQGREVNAADVNCASYYECTDYVGELRRCRRGQRFDNSDQVCKPSSEVRCNRQRSGSRQTTSKPLETTTTPPPTSTTTEAAPRSKRPGLVSLLGALLPQFGGGAGILGLNGNAALAPAPFNDGGYQPVNQGPAFFNAPFLNPNVAPNFGNAGAFNGFPQQTNFFPYPNTNQFGFNSAFGNPQPQFPNNGFGTHQFSNNGYGTAQFPNNGFGTPQFPNNGFGNQASVEVENPVQPIVVHLQPYPPQVQTPAITNLGQQNVLTDLSGGQHSKVPDQVYQPSNHSPAEFFPAITQVGNFQASPKISGTGLPADSSRNKREALREHLLRSLKAMTSSDKNEPTEQADTQVDRKPSESINSLTYAKQDLLRQAIGMLPSLESLAQTLDINFDAVKLAKHVISQFSTIRHGLSDLISDVDVSYVQKLANEIRRIEGSTSKKQGFDLVSEKTSKDISREPGSKSLQTPHSFQLGQLKPKFYDQISSSTAVKPSDDSSFERKNSTTFSAYYPQSAANEHSPPSKGSHTPAQRDSRYRPTKYRPRIDQIPPQQLDQPRYYLPATGQFSSQYQPKYYKQHTKHMPALPSVQQGRTGHPHAWNTPVANRHHSKFSSRTYNSKGYPRMKTQRPVTHFLHQPTYEPLPSTDDASVLPRYYTSLREDRLETPLMDNNGLSSINLSESNPDQTLRQVLHYPPSGGRFKKLDEEPQNKLQRVFVHTNSSRSADDNIRLTLQSQVTLQLKNLKMPIILNTDGHRINFAMNGNENKP